jgi:hypothetical protein
MMYLFEALQKRLPVAQLGIVYTLSFSSFMEGHYYIAFAGHHNLLLNRLISKAATAALQM